jgi:SpoVK/Ycf46/Vps4 family AAA+-type ATPase
MTGPAGTGKTAMAEAVAKEAGINCVILNPARIFGKYVGDTERNLDRALYAILAMAPVLVFIDEIDQSVSRGASGDSGVSNRFFKRLMEFMSDTSHRGKVIFLAASNRPDLMDPALRRPGRFDKKIPFLIPDEAERESIFAVMAHKYELAIKTVPAECVQKADGWTGAEIELATVKSLEAVEYDGMLPEDALIYAVNNMRPSTADIEYMTLLALQECNERDLLPKKYQAEFDNKADLKKRIDQMAPAATRGKRDL